MLGVMSAQEALFNAKDKGLDLIEISPNSDPPTCKIMDFGKYKYEQQKKRHKQKITEIKELKMRPVIAKGDYEVKLRNIQKFIKHGDKVKVSIVFKGREKMHEDIGYKLASKLIEDVKEFAKAEGEQKMENNQIIITFIGLK